MLGAVTVTMGSGSRTWRKDRWEPGDGDEMCGWWIQKAECEKAVLCLPGGVMPCLLRKPWPSGHFPLSSGRGIHAGTLVVPSAHVYVTCGQPVLFVLASKNVLATRSPPVQCSARTLQPHSTVAVGLALWIGPSMGCCQRASLQPQTKPMELTG